MLANIFDTMGCFISHLSASSFVKPVALDNF